MNATLENIQKRGDALLVDVTKNGKRHRVTCATVEEALAVRSKLQRATGHEPEGWTLEEAINACHETCWRGIANEENSLRNAALALNFFGKNTPVNEITQDWLDGYLAQLRKAGSSNGTINRKMATLSRVLSYAVECRKLSPLDKPKFRRQKEMEGRMRILTNTEEEQVLGFLGQWGKEDEAECVCILVDSGLRPSELFRLEARDCDFNVGKHGAMQIAFTKNGKTRVVPMTLRVKEILQRRVEITATGPLFPFDKDWLIRAWSRVRSVMGQDHDKEFIPYALRHTCASRLVQRGVPLTVIQKWLGHESIRVTQRYAKIRPEDLFAAVDVLER
jgi:integrase